MFFGLTIGLTHCLYAYHCDDYHHSESECREETGPLHPPEQMSYPQYRPTQDITQEEDETDGSDYECDQP